MKVEFQRLKLEIWAQIMEMKAKEVQIGKP